MSGTKRKLEETPNTAQSPSVEKKAAEEKKAVEDPPEHVVVVNKWHQRKAVSLSAIFKRMQELKYSDGHSIMDYVSIVAPHHPYIAESQEPWSVDHPDFKDYCTGRTISIDNGGEWPDDFQLHAFLRAYEELPGVPLSPYMPSKTMLWRVSYCEYPYVQTTTIMKLPSIPEANILDKCDDVINEFRDARALVAGQKFDLKPWLPLGACQCHADSVMTDICEIDPYCTKDGKLHLKVETYSGTTVTIHQSHVEDSGRVIRVPYDFEDAQGLKTWLYDELEIMHHHPDDPDFSAAPLKEK